jgi:hypothetical protein
MPSDYLVCRQDIVWRVAICPPDNLWIAYDLFLLDYDRSGSNIFHDLRQTVLNILADAVSEVPSVMTPSATVPV